MIQLIRIRNTENKSEHFDQIHFSFCLETQMTREFWTESTTPWCLEYSIFVEYFKKSNFGSFYLFATQLSS